MNGLDMLGVMLDGFGWALVLVACAACVAYLYRDALVALCCRALDYDGLDVEEVATIEDARAELARKAREREERKAKLASI